MRIAIGRSQIDHLGRFTSFPSMRIELPYNLLPAVHQSYDPSWLKEQERDASIRLADESELKLAQLERKRKAMEAHIAALRAEFEADAAEVEKSVSLDNKREKKLIDNRSAMANSRRVNGHVPQTPERE